MIGHRTWPALNEEWFGEWIIRAAGGMTRRNNSVTPMGDPGMDLEAAIDRAERWFDRHDLPPIFRLTELAPADLQSRLDARGYRRADTTLVMARAIPDQTADPAVHVSVNPTPAWLSFLVDDRQAAAEYRRTFERLHTDQTLAPGFSELRIDGLIVAIGLIVVSGAHAVIFNMKTRPDRQRQGLATRVLGSLTSHASRIGAEFAMLQVRDDNHAAIRLYTRQGFNTRYDYWYYQRRCPS